MTTTVSAVRAVLLRDLDALAAQVRAYPNDAALWKPVPGMANPGGTLALHLAGNLRAFVGAELGKSGYVRDREAEFSARGLPPTEVLARIAAARDEVDRGLAALPEAALAQPFPQEVGGARLTVGQLLLHLIAHLGYHLGQVDYHRRAVTGAGGVPGMISAKALTAAG
jgi:hypothetical protein